MHRDLKPENVLLSGSHALLADFGVAKALHDAAWSGSRTATGVAIGTPAYMAPEQAAGDPQIDHRADLYAIGVLAYELLTGAPPFAGGSPQQLLAAHLTRNAEPLAAIRPTVPPAVAAAVMRCLEKRPADRWQSAEELLQALGSESARVGVGAPVRPPSVAGSLVVTEDLCRRLDRASFDPRMIGDRLNYRDNQVASDVLVLMIHGWGLEAADPAAALPEVPFRMVIPTLFGFDNRRKVRFPIGVSDHLVLLEALLVELTERIRPRLVVIGGFSAGGDLVLRLAAGAGPATRIDGCLSLGSNLGLDTCFVTGVLGDVASSAAEVVLPALNSALSRAGTVNDWLNLSDYLVRILGNFRDDWRPIQRFAQDIVAPWREPGIAAFVRWYRTATEAGRRVRAVFEDNELYRAQVRELQLRNLDERVLGESYRPGSIVVEPVAGHFDLLAAELVTRQLEALVADLRG